MTILAGVVILVTSLVCSESVDRVDHVRAADECMPLVQSHCGHMRVSVELFTQTVLVQQRASMVTALLDSADSSPG